MRREGKTQFSVILDNDDCKELERYAKERGLSRMGASIKIICSIVTMPEEIRADIKELCEKRSAEFENLDDDKLVRYGDVIGMIKKKEAYEALKSIL